jgi:nucleoside-diphosphate-sugar epimerase
VRHRLLLTRRRFMRRAAALGASLTAARSWSQPVLGSGSPPLRILILGGTGNIGPYHVRAAVERGHNVSVFSRGKTQADLPAAAERLTGDRSGDLESIKDRDWDAVIDLATYGPAWVRSLGEAIQRRTKHYTFVSTISVYADPQENDQTTEDSPLLSYDGSADPYSIVDNGEHYGALKVLCETEAEKQFRGRTAILRPGFIGGPDETHGVLSYWAARGEIGGEILAAGDRSTPVQYIDVRDMAEWVIRLVERNLTGTYNTLSTNRDLAEVIETAALAAPSPPTITWIPSDWLSEQEGAEVWGTVRFWELNEGYLTRISNAQAVSNGLTFRPLSETLTDTLTWYKQQPKDRRSTLNTGFRRDPATGTFYQARESWPEFIRRERETLRAWHSAQG